MESVAGPREIEERNGTYGAGGKKGKRRGEKGR